MAERLQNKYWIYIVENTLNEPKLYTIQNPASNLKAQLVIGVIKIAVNNWKETIQK